MTYQEFIDSKTRVHLDTGINVDVSNDALHPFQQYVVKWALAKGRACIFAGTGLGKTRMQIECARLIKGVRLIVAPLAVAEQTIKESECFEDVSIKRVYGFEDLDGDGIYITNYDRLERFETAKIDCVILDESSIIKNHDSATRHVIQNQFAQTPYRFAFTATPSPNDYMELGTHAEFVGAMSREEMLATYFVHDGGETSKWRLKKHAKSDFWKWVSSWACVFSHPRDLGFETDGYDLPDLLIKEHKVEVESTVGGGLFGDSSVSATKLPQVLRDSALERVMVVKSIVENDPGGWLIWANTNHEQDLIEKHLPGIASVRGKDKESHKVDALIGFSTGKYDSLVTKPKIAGYGMNWQRTHKMIFCGVTYSYEQVYQAIRRQWRYGQTKTVEVHFVICNAQESVMAALEAKKQAHEDMALEIKKYCTKEVLVA